MGFLNDLIGSLIEQALDFVAVLFASLGRNVFFIEDIPGVPISAEHIDSLFFFVQGIAVSFVVLKALQKGFFTYVLWKDGDPDEPIIQSVINIALALVATVSFPSLYRAFGELAVWITEEILAITFRTIEIDFSGIEVEKILLVDPTTLAYSKGTTILAIMLLIYLIMIVVLYFQLLTRGAQLLILRVGFPLATVGLISSDKGVFVPTIKAFLQVALTTISQLFFMVFSITCLIGVKDGNPMGLVLAIVFAMAAFGVPVFLGFIMMPSGGGGGAQKIGSVAHTITTVKSLIGK